MNISLSSCEIVREAERWWDREREIERERERV